MKQMTNYQRVANYLVKIFKAVNNEYFNGTLETPTITIQSSVGAYGHISVNKVWDANGISTYELNIGAETLNRPIENVVATMIHEASHEYALINNIKDTSNHGVYHNKRFKQIAEEMGHLQIDRHDKYGWTILDEQTGDFTQEGGQKVMESYLKSYNGKFNVVVCQNDNEAFGAIDAMKAAGVSYGVDGDVIVISFDACTAGLQKVLAGEINATCIFPSFQSVMSFPLFRSLGWYPIFFRKSTIL